MTRKEPGICYSLAHLISRPKYSWPIITVAFGLLVILNPVQSMAENIVKKDNAAATLAGSNNTENDFVSKVCQFQPQAGPEMLVIAEGKFLMGTPTGTLETLIHNYYYLKSPQRSANILKPFAISRCEVSVAEFKRFIEATGYKTEAEKNKGCYAKYKLPGGIKKHGITWRNPGLTQENKDSHPVVCISWFDVQKYIIWLNDSLGLTDKPYRLPTEEEWEYAARAGTVTRYFWDNDSQCVYANGADDALKSKSNGQFPVVRYANCSDKFVTTAPVGTFKPNAWGLYDMVGNVMEWVGDCFKRGNGESDNCSSKPFLSKVTKRTVRGGAWDNEFWEMKSDYRIGIPSDEAHDNLGFRLARTL